MQRYLSFVFLFDLQLVKTPRGSSVTCGHVQLRSCQRYSGMSLGAVSTQKGFISRLGHLHLGIKQMIATDTNASVPFSIRNCHILNSK